MYLICLKFYLNTYVPHFKYSPVKYFYILLSKKIK